MYYFCKDYKNANVTNISCFFKAFWHKLSTIIKHAKTKKQRTQQIIGRRI